MVYILLSLVFVAFLILVFAPEQKVSSVEVEVEQSVQAVPTVQAEKAIQFLAKTSIVGAIIPQQLPSIFIVEEEDLDWGNFVIPTESSMKLSRAHYALLEKTSQYSGKKIKWSSIYGREFGTRRKFKMKRAQSRQYKRFVKQFWSSYNEFYEDELPYQIEKVVLTNKRDSYLAIK